MEDTIIKNRQSKTKQLIIEQLKKTPIIELTCQKVNIGRATFYRWRKNNEKFAEQVEQALEEGLSKISDLAESKLISAIQDDNLTAIIFWLKSRHSAYKNRVELSTAEKPKEELNPEQKKAIEQVLALEHLAEPENINQDKQDNKEEKTYEHAEQ